MKFHELKLNEFLNKNIETLGFNDLTDVQDRVIPEIMANKDVTILSQTGSGKTFAFLIPILNKMLEENTDPTLLSLLVIVPTRELASQISEEAAKLLSGTSFVSKSFFGGVDMGRQFSALKKGVSVAVFTPGRLIDFIERQVVKTDSLKFLVIDEADRLFDMGFYDDIKYIMKKFKGQRQTVLASATLSGEVLDVAHEYLKDPVQVEVTPEEVTVDGARQLIYHLGRREKPRFLINFLKDESHNLVMVFVNTKQMVTELEKLLKINEFKAKGISSLLSQNIRTRLLKEFRDGSFNILIATDVASRGLDIEGINHVINYDLPEYIENYVHRIGRTARAGREGMAVSLCSEYDYDLLHKIEAYIGKKIETGEVSEDYLVEVPKPVIYKSERRFKKPEMAARGKGRIRDKCEKDMKKTRNDRSDGNMRERDKFKKYNRKSQDQYHMPSSMMDSEPMVTVYKRGSYIDPIEAKKELLQLADKEVNHDKKDFFSGVKNFFGDLFKGKEREAPKLEKKEENRSNRVAKREVQRERKYKPQKPRRNAGQRNERSNSVDKKEKDGDETRSRSGSRSKPKPGGRNAQHYNRNRNRGKRY